MEVAPKLLREVEFPEKLRGYHPDHVDEFLEQVAVGVEQLQERLRQANERADRAEAHATESSGDDDLLRRTLLLAQRTADMAVAEANQQAQAIVADAQASAGQIRAEAQGRANQLLAEAEAAKNDADSRARVQIEEGEKALQDALGRLASARKEVAADLAAMRSELAENREKAITVHTEAIRWLEGAFPVPGRDAAPEAPARPSSRPAPGRSLPDEIPAPVVGLVAHDPREADDGADDPVPRAEGLRGLSSVDPEDTPTAENSIVNPASGNGGGLHRRRS